MPARRSRCNRHDASTLHTREEEKQKRRNQNQQPRAVSADMQRRRCCNHADSAAAFERKLRVGGWKWKNTRRTHKKTKPRADHCSAENEQPARSVLRRRPKNSMPERDPPVPCYEKCARFKRCHQSIDTRVKVSVWFTQIAPYSETPCGAAEGLSAHAANTPTRLAHAGLALGAASTGR
jgi:hypothetical protein